MADKERKQQIIRTALKRFIKHGLNKTTLEEVARDLRIGKATLYHYFNSKEDLYNQTLRYEISLYLSDIKTLFASNDIDFRKKLSEFFLLKESFQSNYKLLYDLVIHVITGTEFPDEKIIFDELLTKEREFFKEITLSEPKKSSLSAEETAFFIVREGWSMIFDNRFKTKDLPDSKEFITNIIERL
jgi:AcrR family transcriptional regulator